ncbi:exopolyphosphatase PRUNE1-like [Megalops cyprinoides]|uniref:exopolyphosphatase PRUNE1-like n=1 Tax=Megalops cyprinoides TaxID=118141 RepID=UPI001864F1EA|nr:exopolyphosphatase PRUNE1-like [Megalops cyprinoides]
MEGFLRSCSAVFKNGSEDGSGVHVVLGNEACDVDSMVSALTFAYFLFKTSGSAGKTPVPVLNIPRSEFPLRTDNAFLLRESGLAQESLVFRDEVDLLGLHRAGRLALSLVDHNVLPSADSDLEGAVVEVIDHHHLERLPSPSCPVTVETVGSCATLVTERIAQKAPEILDRQVAQLLYGTIVLDCVNMAPEAGKVTPKDSQYAFLLESRFPDLPPRGALFQSLQSAKFDVSGLTTEQMLLKDMKAASGGDLKLAVSVVYMTLDAFLQRRGLKQELCEFCHKHRFNLVVAMTISFNENNEPFRQLAVYSSSTLYREEVSQALERAQNPCLNLSPMSSPYADVKAYIQGNTLASRKKVLPIVKDFLREWERRTTRCGDLDDLDELEDQFDPSRSPGVDDDTRPRRYSASRQRRPGAVAAEDSGPDEDAQVPPTPMNSLVEGCPLDNGMPRISAEAILEKFSKMAEAEPGEGGAAGEL